MNLTLLSLKKSTFQSHRLLVCKREVNCLWIRCYSKQGPLAAGYQPKQVESGKRLWEQNNLKKVCNRGTFRMILPPPNVTGQLHLGHALMAIIQDVICRHKRQLGYSVEWVPGTDHAGIATQVVVEKKVYKDKGLSRHQLGREAFLKEVWKWKNEKGSSIIDDLKKLGCTLDWNREYFTMDKNQAEAVNMAFVKLFEAGLIKRKKSLVNWSCALESAISDIEVDNMELKGPTEIAVPGYDKHVSFGRLYDISYRICDMDSSTMGGEDEIVVSTTRPETMLGDVAVAVHPEDPRYVKYRNFPDIRLWHPFRKEPIPLVFDIMVEQEFGTGAVKITPAHDKNDFEMATRHLLEAKPVFTEQGRILNGYAGFENMQRFEARKKILEELAALGLLRGVKDHAMNLPICSRSKDVIEYMLREQWFLHCQPLADLATAEVRSGRLQILPPNFETEWFRWLDDCHDWCISRQLWWGHQIPAYLAKNSENDECWIAAINDEEAWQKAKSRFKGADSSISVKRDTDVLDTWFSSSLLPFSAFGWPSEEYRSHYPLDLLETGHDILFFWVARMAMLGLQLTGSAPFKKILLNGIVCDAHGRKMSKSLGNIVTPQQVVQGASLESLREDLQSGFKTGMLNADELQRSLQGLQKMFPAGIPECGTDALRFTLCSHNIKSHFINFDINECHTNRLFFNKIWQATRFTLNAAERLRMPLHEIESMNDVPLGNWDAWILSRLAETLQVTAESFENFNLHSATNALKDFLYYNLCDVYLETTKANINAGNHEGYIHCATLVTCLSWALQAMSPFTPFIASELLQHLPQDIHWNPSKCRNEQLEREVNDILDICYNVRQLKSRNMISRKHDPRVCLYMQSEEAFTEVQAYLNEMRTLTQTNELLVQMDDKSASNEKKHNFFSTAGHMCSFGISVNDAYKEFKTSTDTRAEVNHKKLEKLQTELQRIRERVENDGFRKSASEQVQRKAFEKIKQLEVEIQNIKALAS